MLLDLILSKHLVQLGLSSRADELHPAAAPPAATAVLHPVWTVHQSPSIMPHCQPSPQQVPSLLQASIPTAWCCDMVQASAWTASSTHNSSTSSKRHTQTLGVVVCLPLLLARSFIPSKQCPCCFQKVCCFPPTRLPTAFHRKQSLYFESCNQDVHSPPSSHFLLPLMPTRPAGRCSCPSFRVMQCWQLA